VSAAAVALGAGNTEAGSKSIGSLERNVAVHSSHAALEVEVAVEVVA